MAEIKGKLTDVGWVVLTARQPVLRFHPRAKSGSLSRYEGRVLSHSPVDAVITGTEWSVNLVPTEGMVPESWYELELIELGDAGEYVRSWWWGARIYFGPDGGAFDTLPGGPMSPSSVWIGLTPPADSWAGYWLYSPGPGEVMPVDDLRIGGLIPGPGPFIY